MARTNVFRLKDTAVSRLRTELTGNTDKLIFRPTKNNDEHIWKDPINNTPYGAIDSETSLDTYIVAAVHMLSDAGSSVTISRFWHVGFGCTHHTSLQGRRQ